jgi:hypothetical protein
MLAIKVPIELMTLQTKLTVIADYRRFLSLAKSTIFLSKTQEKRAAHPPLFSYVYQSPLPIKPIIGNEYRQ